MRNSTTLLAAGSLLAIISLASVAAIAQSGAAKAAPAAKPQPAPRTRDGRPDLSGFWRGPLLRNMDKNVPGGFKAIFTPAGAGAYEYNLTQTINPEGLCLFAGIPRASISGVPFEIVQSSNRVAFLYELMWTFRSIPTDRREHPKDVEPSFFGHGVGRWEGDTLVIDSVGFKDHLTWLDDDAHPHSDAMHVIERWRLPDADHLAHEVTVEDSKFYTRPFTFDRVFTRMAPDQELIEFACNENNKDLPHLGFGPHDPSIYPPTPPAKK